jgi:DNA polymerase III delta prime subunit
MVSKHTKKIFSSSGSYILKTNRPLSENEISKMFFDIDDENNPDLISIRVGDLDKVSIGITDIKDKLKEFQYKKIKHPVKILLIYDADRLTKEAQNALLKTLEEPSTDNHIFLICFDTNKLLSTIKSRCELIDLKDSNLDMDTTNFLNSSLFENFNYIKEILSIKDNKEKKGRVETLFRNIANESKKLSTDKRYKIEELIVDYSIYFASEVNLRLVLENFIIKINQILHK